MSRGIDTISLIKNRFAGQDRLIERAFLENDDFRSLCEDYRACSEALEGWDRSESDVAAQRRKEYTELLEDLSREMQAWLENEA